MSDSAHRSNHQDLVKILGKRIRSYKKQYPRLSSKQIAKRFNMSNSSFNRIENGDIKIPNLDQALKVLRGTGCKDILGYLEEFFPEIAETYKEIHKQTLTREYVDISIEKYFEDPKTFIFMLLAYSQATISREYIRLNFGAEGTIIVDELIAKGAITVDSQGNISQTDKVIRLSDDVSKQLLLNSIESCNDPDSEDSSLFFMSESINLDKVRADINEIIDEANHKIRSVIFDPKNRGEDQFYFGLVADTLLKGDSGRLV